ncbi:hypothetical protein PR048_008489 [Dryococelus australis]|uniref:Uncharacterized protein n=1 Tax=Dryococelus australis TaxID=614101 RepID=A0ABQ9HXB8_9NEOP|nr:hypothetical protein PR048_008489 [Dryococelus australis]
MGSTKHGCEAKAGTSEVLSTESRSLHIGWRSSPNHQPLLSIAESTPHKKRKQIICRGAGMKGREKREIPEKTRRPMVSFGTILARPPLPLRLVMVCDHCGSIIIRNSWFEVRQSMSIDTSTPLSQDQDAWFPNDGCHTVITSLKPTHTAISTRFLCVQRFEERFENKGSFWSDQEVQERCSISSTIKPQEFFSRGICFSYRSSSGMLPAVTYYELQKNSRFPEHFHPLYKGKRRTIRRKHNDCLPSRRNAFKMWRVAACELDSPLVAPDRSGVAFLKYARSLELTSHCAISGTLQEAAAENQLAVMLRLKFVFSSYENRNNWYRYTPRGIEPTQADVRQAAAARSYIFAACLAKHSQPLAKERRDNRKRVRKGSGGRDAREKRLLTEKKVEKFNCRISKNHLLTAPSLRAFSQTRLCDGQLSQGRSRSTTISTKLLIIQSLATGEIFSMTLWKAVEVERTAISTKDVSRGGMQRSLGEVIQGSINVGVPSEESDGAVSFMSEKVDGIVSAMPEEVDGSAATGAPSKELDVTGLTSIVDGTGYCSQDLDVKNCQIPPLFPSGTNDIEFFRWDICSTAIDFIRHATDIAIDSFRHATDSTSTSSDGTPTVVVP